MAFRKALSTEPVADVVGSNSITYPSVGTLKLVTGPATINTIVGGSYGDILTIQAVTGIITLAHGADNLSLGGSNSTIAVGKLYDLQYNGSDWVSKSSSASAETGGASDADAIHSSVVAEISALTAKAMPVGADHFVIEDSAALDAKKVSTLTEIADTLAGGNLTNTAGVLALANSPSVTSTIIAHSASGYTSIGNSSNGQLRLGGTGNYGRIQRTQDAVEVSFGNSVNTGVIVADCDTGEGALIIGTETRDANASLQVAGISGTTAAITAFADAGGGEVLVTSASMAGLNDGMTVTIQGTTNYNGEFTISAKTGTTFKITDTWVADDATGTWHKGTYSGFLPPRMTTTQRDLIPTPPEGLIVYNTSTSKLNVYTGAAWEAVTSA